jgi:Holliday junction resolvasome RuvABC endonuclease subunit
MQLTRVILGIDPATRCGWAVYDGHTRYSAGAWQLPPPRGDAQEEGARFLALMRHLSGIKRVYPQIDTIFYEAVKAHKSTRQAHLYGGWVAAIQTWAHIQRVRHDSATPHYHPLMYSAVKKWATGKGNATKEAMREHMKATISDDRFRWDIDINDADAVDALWVLMYGQHAIEEGIYL